MLWAFKLSNINLYLSLCCVHWKWIGKRVPHYQKQTKKSALVPHQLFAWVKFDFTCRGFLYNLYNIRFLSTPIDIEHIYCITRTCRKWIYDQRLNYWWIQRKSKFGEIFRNLLHKFVTLRDLYSVLEVQIKSRYK